MKVDVYTSSCNPRKHLSVPAGKQLADVQFPPDLDRDLHKVTPFKANVDTTSAVALDAADVEQQIAANGFAVHSTTLEIDVFAPHRDA